MKNTNLFALLMALTLGFSTQIIGKQVSINLTEQTETASINKKDSQSADKNNSCCISASAASSWLANTWCSAKHWVMNLFGIKTYSTEKTTEDIELIAEAEQDPEANNIPFQK